MPWCNGTVGLHCVSYSMLTQFTRVCCCGRALCLELRCFIAVLKLPGTVCSENPRSGCLRPWSTINQRTATSIPDSLYPWGENQTISEFYPQSLWWPFLILVQLSSQLNMRTSLIIRPDLSLDLLRYMLDSHYCCYNRYSNCKQR